MLPEPAAVEQLLIVDDEPLNVLALEKHLRNLGYAQFEHTTDSRRVFWHGKPVELAPREIALLELLLASPQRVLSRATLQQRLYHFEQDIDSNALEVHVHHLRRKLHPAIVRTVRGVGYALGPAEAGGAR